jgi:hypothetical protein
MQRFYKRILIGAFILSSLIPALIHGTRPGSEATRLDPFSKLPPVITVGAESSPYALTEREVEKLSLVIQSPAYSQRPMTEDRATIANTGKYTGLTGAELRKLHRSDIRAKSNHGPVTDKNPVSTVERMQRAAGEEGMTMKEKTKLEAWKNFTAKTPRTGNGE